MKKYAQALIYLVLAILLALPLNAYIKQFGFGLWSSPSDWADLGSYFGGIYAPILTIVTLFLILTQIHLQHQQHNQTLIQHQEQTLNEYINELSRELSSEYQGDVKVRDILIALFRDHDAELIHTINSETIFRFNEKHHKIYSMWCGVLICIELLESYSPIHAATSKNRIVAHLNPQVCRTIDKYHYAFKVACKNLGTPVEFTKEKYHFWAMSQGA